MKRRAFAQITMAAATLLAACGASHADANLDKACKVLAETAAKAKAENHTGDIAQMDFVFALANAFGDTPQYLGTFASNADEWTTAACPQARTDTLAVTGASSLGALLR